MPTIVPAALWGGRQLCSPAALRAVSPVISGEHRLIPAGEARIKPAFLFYVPAAQSRIRRNQTHRALQKRVVQPLLSSFTREYTCIYALVRHSLTSSAAHEGLNSAPCIKVQKTATKCKVC